MLPKTLIHSLITMSLCFVIAIANASSVDNIFNESMPAVKVDFNECQSFFGGSNFDYSEFTGEQIVNPACSQIELAAPGYVYRSNPQANTHSCTYGVGNSIGMCITANNFCFYDAGNEKSLKFNIKVTPAIDGFGSIEHLSFYEKAPEQFEFFEGATGENDYPTLYAVRVLVNGTEIFRQIDIPTSREWNYTSFDFSQLGQFTVTKNTVFNFEGGCYAKVINLSQEQEPEIFAAIKKGAILENVIMDDKGAIDFADTSITQNTRVSYPIYHIDNIKKPSIGENPKNIFFLTADAFGVLPPISKLTPNQAAYHFISGYTAKVAGTEAGIKEPTPSFSACFGAPFMPLHPTRYAEMLSKKMKDAGVNVWLINTGWSGGQYGVGRRMPLKYTRAMISAVLNGDLGSYRYEDYHIHSVFGVAQPRSCPGVPTELLSPRATWDNDEEYYKTAFKLSNAFRNNFTQFEEVANEDIRRGGPQRYAF